METDLKLYSKTNFKRKKMIMIAKIFEKRNAYIYNMVGIKMRA